MAGPRSEQAPAAGREGHGLTHVDGAGRARMVDVTGKPWTRRRAVARCRIVPGEAAAFAGPAARASPAVPAAWVELLEACRMAGIQAAKQTSRLIPLCHPLTSSEVHVMPCLAQGCIEIETRAEVVGPTGVEMEALTACAIAALTAVAALLPSDPTISIEDLTLWEKSGGRSGTWVRRGHQHSPRC